MDRSISIDHDIYSLLPNFIISISLLWQYFLANNSPPSNTHCSASCKSIYRKVKRKYNLCVPHCLSSVRTDRKLTQYLALVELLMGNVAVSGCRLSHQTKKRFIVAKFEASRAPLHHPPSAVMSSCPALASLQNCSIPTSYIRPDEGFAVMPWIFGAALFLAHLASSVCRIFLKPYDRSQLLAIVLAVYAVAVTILAYQSTRFEAQKIMIWTPLMVAGDVAALIHLIKEQYPNGPKPSQGSDNQESQELLDRHRQDRQQAGKIGRQRNTTDILCMIISIILLVTSILLQVAGLVFAIIRFLRRSQLQLQTTWCSPACQLGNETFNSECTHFPIVQHETLGIACVSVPGNQATWLGWTVVGVLVLLIVELSEVAILFLPQFKKFRVNRGYRAPIVTTLAGIIVWVSFIVIGFIQIRALPAGLSENRLGIVSSMEGTCAFDAFPGGLRGTIIAWSDGLFGGWSLYQ